MELFESFTLLYYMCASYPKKDFNNSNVIIIGRK